MSGLYAITTNLIRRLKRQAWDRHFDQGTWDDGQLHSTGVQPLVDELLAGLADTGATQMAGTWNLVAPQNGPAFNIVVDNIDNIDNGITVTDNTTNNTINMTQIVNNINNLVGSGFSGSVAVVTNATFSASVSGCTVTITPSFTTTTLTFQDGICTGAS